VARQRRMRWKAKPFSSCSATIREDTSSEPREVGWLLSPAWFRAAHLPLKGKAFGLAAYSARKAMIDRMGRNDILTGKTDNSADISFLFQRYMLSCCHGEKAGRRTRYGQKIRLDG